MSNPDLLHLIFEQILLLAHQLKKTRRHPAGLHVSAASLLQLLQQSGPQSVPQLARIRGSSRQNIQLAVNRLIRAGTVEWRPNPAHKRSDFVQITDSGQALLTDFARKENEFLRGLPSQFSQGEAHSCLALLRQLRETISIKGSRENVPKFAVPRPNVEPEAAIEENELPISLL